MIANIFNSIKLWVEYSVNYLNNIGILTLTISVGSGLALFIFLKLFFKIVGRRIKTVIVKKEINRIIFFFSVLLSFELSRLAFLKHYGSGILWVIIVYHFYRLFEYLGIEYFLINRKKKYVPKIIRDIVKAGVLVILLLFLLKTFFDFSFTNIAITSAAVTAILAFALQDTFVNLIAGISISIEKPFKIGDWIKVKSDIIGEVIQTSWRTTRLLTLTRDLYIIPNREVANTEFFNFYKPHKTHGIILKIGVSYDHPPNDVKSTILNILLSTEGIVSEPSPNVRLVNYNNSSMDYELRYWIDNYPDHVRIQDDVLSKIWYSFRREGIVIPFPITTVEFRKPKSAAERELPLELFRSCPIFTPLNESIFNEVINGFKRLKFGRGEMVLKYDQEGPGLFLIETGKLEIIARDRFENKKHVTVVERGDFFGELSLLTGARTKADVIVIEDAELLFVKKETFRLLVQKHPDLLVALSDVADSRIDEILRMDEEDSKDKAKKSDEKKNILRKLFEYLDN